MNATHQIIQALNTDIARITALRDFLAANVEKLRGFCGASRGGGFFMDWSPLLQIHRNWDSQLVEAQGLGDAKALARMFGPDWMEDGMNTQGMAWRAKEVEVPGMVGAKMDVIIHGAVEVPEAKTVVRVDLGEGGAA